MKPHPRIRKTVKWAGPVVCIAVAAVWVGSAREYVAWGNGSNAIGAGHGALLAAVVRPPSPHTTHYLPTGRAFGPDYRPLRWWFHAFRYPAEGWQVEVPLWSFILPAALATAAAWRFDSLARRRARPGICSSCGYDRAGLPPASPCPECAALPVTPTAAPM